MASGNTQKMSALMDLIPDLLSLPSYLPSLDLNLNNEFTEYTKNVRINELDLNVRAEMAKAMTETVEEMNRATFLELMNWFWF
jgi:hypothetical protein